MNCCAVFSNKKCATRKTNTAKPAQEKENLDDEATVCCCFVVLIGKGGCLELLHHMFALPHLNQPRKGATCKTTATVPAQQKKDLDHDGTVVVLAELLFDEYG